MPSEYEKRVREEEQRRLAEEYDWLQQNQERGEIDVEELKRQGDMEEGDFLQDPEAPYDFNQAMQIGQHFASQGMPPEINPDAWERKTDRQKEREDRLRKRAGSGQQGADIAKKKLPPEAQTDLPPFLQSVEMGEIYNRDKELYGEFDRLVEEARNSSGREKKALLQRAGRIREQIESGKDPMTIGELGYKVADTLLPDPRNPAEMAEFTLDAYMAVQSGGVIPAAKLLAKKTIGKKLFKEVWERGSRILPGGRYSEVVEDAATGMKMDVADMADNVPTTRYEMAGSGGGGGFVQPELPIQRFQTVPYQQKVVAKMSEFGMSDGTFRMRAFDANKGKFKGNTKERRMLEAYLSPDRLKGSFSGFKNANKGTWQRTWGDFLESKGLSGIDDIQVHHINALYDSIHLFDGVTFNSKEYWDIITTLIGRNARTGTIQRTGDVNNLMMTLGKATNIETPHGIAHKLYNDLTPSFFSPKEMSRITNPKGFTDEVGKVWKPGEYRIYKAEEWAKIVNQSEEVILEAHKQWSALNPKIDVSFDDLIEYMSKFDDTGFNKLLSNEYQLPDIKNMVMDIKLDMMLNPLKNIPFPKLSQLKQEVLRDRAAGMSNKELKRKYGKNLDIKQLDLFDQ